MTTLPRLKKLPNYAILSDEIAERYSRLTSQGVYDLVAFELFWQERQPYLKKAGYLLRPRYTPNWKPSWRGTNLDPTYCEDSIMLLDYQVIDATRLSDNEVVAIKTFLKDKEEMDIAQFFSTIKDPMNHCVEVYEILPDPFEHESALMVMPFLRPCNDPDWSTIGDIVEFVSQTIEGLYFMHRHNVAHRDICIPNIMMDAKALYPDGHHPVRLGYSRDAMHEVSPLPRAGRTIRYLYIDFGLSKRFPPGIEPSVVGDVGREKDVPELSDTVPYDPFKVDIFTLGTLYSKEFAQKYSGTEFLESLVESMTQHEPTLRPSAEQLLRNWEKARRDLNKSSFRWRLSPKGEPALERVLNNTVAVAWQGINHLKSLVS